VRKGHSQALIGQKVGTVEKWRLRAVPRVDWGPETGRLEAVEAVGNTVPRKARYSWTACCPAVFWSVVIMHLSILVKPTTWIWRLIPCIYIQLVLSIFADEHRSSKRLGFLGQSTGFTGFQ